MSGKASIIAICRPCRFEGPNPHPFPYFYVMVSTDFSQQFDNSRTSAPDQLGPEHFGLFRSSIESLSRSDITDRLLKVGDTAPGFKLLNQHSQYVLPATCLEEDLAVISIYRTVALTATSKYRRSNQPSLRFSDSENESLQSRCREKSTP